MANIPTISQIYNDIKNDLINKLDLSDDNLKKVLDAISLTLSGQFKLMYLFLSDIQENIFPDTADIFENGGTLDRLGMIYLNRTRNPATSGIFKISVTGVNGSVLRSGLTFKSNDDSLNPANLYVSDDEYILNGNNDFIEIRSLNGGVDSLLEIGDSLTITEPVIGVDKVVIVDSIIDQPISEESIEDYRDSILKSIQLEPEGGAKTDYRLWAADANGVRFVYPYVKNGEAGTVQIYVEAVDVDSTDGLGTPSQAILDDVQSVIEFDPDETIIVNNRGRIPIQANLEVLPIVLNAVDVTITGLEEDTAEIRTSIEENLKLYLKSVRPYVAGADLARNKNDILYAARLQSVVTDTISISNFFVNFNMFVNGVVQVSYIFSRENIPYLRNLTFD